MEALLAIPGLAQAGGNIVSSLIGGISDMSTAAIQGENAMRLANLQSDLTIKRFNTIQDRATDSLRMAGLPSYLLYTNQIPLNSMFNPGTRTTLATIQGADPRWSATRSL